MGFNSAFKGLKRCSPNTNILHIEFRRTSRK